MSPTVPLRHLRGNLNYFEDILLPSYSKHSWGYTVAASITNTLLIMLLQVTVGKHCNLVA